MKSEILYVELKSGYSDNGPAWIGQAFYSKSGRTVYFNGKAFGKGSGISGNHFDKETGDEYWISGIKKNGSNRHWAGGGKISIDQTVVREFLEMTGLPELPKNKFEITTLDNIPSVEALNEQQNKPL